MKTAAEAIVPLPAASLLRALGLSRATYYRQSALPVCARTAAADPVADPVAEPGAPSRCRVPGRSLDPAEREAVRDLLYGERFVDDTPTEVFAALLDEGVYHCSIRTMYRLLEEEGANTPRTRARRHMLYQKPELLATRPNELWSWDITRLKGPRAWTYFYLYDIMDLFSRYVVGWMVACQENQELAKELIDETLRKQQIEPDQLTLHADRGSPMKSKSVALLSSDLGVLKTHSRPHVSNDNPYSEAQFRTLKYRPTFPERFGCIEDARQLCAELFDWYNGEHHHGGIALLTPAMVHYGTASEVVSKRQALLDAAYRAHPERFVNRPPRHPALPDAVWINPPVASTSTDEASRDASGH